MKSAFLKLNINDLIKSAIMAGLTAIGAVLIPVLESGAFPTLETLRGAAISGICVALVYLLKNFLTTTDDKFVGKV